jgi:hypothetical protein
MPLQYISHPSGTPAEKCMVYPLSPQTGAEAYTLYASASGVDKWRELFAKIEAERDALRGARGVYPTVALDDPFEERRLYSPNQDEREQYVQREREHGSFREFRIKLNAWIESLMVLPVGVQPMAAGSMFEGACLNLQIIADKALCDTVIATIIVLPLDIGQETL